MGVNVFMVTVWVIDTYLDIKHEETTQSHEKDLSEKGKATQGTNAFVDTVRKFIFPLFSFVAGMSVWLSVLILSSFMDFTFRLWRLCADIKLFIYGFPVKALVSSPGPDHSSDTEPSVSGKVVRWSFVANSMEGTKNAQQNEQAH